MSKEMREQIDKIKNFGVFLNEVNINFNDLKFSKEFHLKYKEEINSFKKVYLDKLKQFNYYFNKYNLIGVRIINGVDSYLEAIEIYNKILNKELYVDEVLTSPDNSLRNVIMLLEIDKNKFTIK